LNGGGENGELIPIKNFLDSFYNCHYDQFFVNLASLESQRLKFDRYLSPHYGFYSRAMRLKAYTQFLTPYKTVSSFGTMHFNSFSGSSRHDGP
jgi:26S proteasome regulatory subunit N7